MEVQVGRLVWLTHREQEYEGVRIHMGKGTAERNLSRIDEKLTFHLKNNEGLLESNLGIPVLSSCGVENELWSSLAENFLDQKL